ncbi:hypothetical protein PHYC_01176 [Phycisphaerales bacterium]|nr:hypothetical protein PHYC_01176 [Phycisphaerales bacterium]
MISNDLSPEAHCPRCGYDLRGEIDRWTEQCPLSGICSECGLDLNWIELLSRDGKPIPGFVEEARGRRRIFTAAWKTWLWTFRPRSFWSRVRLERNPSPGRLGDWLLIVIVSLHLAPPLMLLALILLQSLTRGSSSFGLGEVVAAATWPVEYDPYSGGLSGAGLEGTRWSTGIWVAGLATLLFPLVLFALPWTRLRSKVRDAHVTRAAVYSLAWLVPLLLARILHVAAMVIASSFSGRRMGSWRAVARTANNAADLIHECFDAWYLWAPLACAWLFLWWWRALQTGFRMKDARRVYLAMAVPALLGIAIGISRSQLFGHLLVVMRF